VVAGGDASGDLAAATTALADALREAGRIQLVMDATSIRDTAGLDDQAIVARATNLPVDHELFAIIDGEKVDRTASWPAQPEGVLE